MNIVTFTKSKSNKKGKVIFRGGGRESTKTKKIEAAKKICERCVLVL